MEGWLEPRDNREWQGVYGIDNQSFDLLVSLCESSYKSLNGITYEEMLLNNPKGKLARLKSINDLIRYTLLILKSGITFDLSAYLFKFDRSRAHRQFCNGINLLHYTLDNENYLPTRYFDSPEEFGSYFESYETVIIDATEQRIQRPQDQEYQKDAYSGKKKGHTIKSMIISTLDREIHYVSRAYVGSTHDFSLLKSEFDPSLDWFEGKYVRLDLGYLGFGKEYPKSKVFIPHKKPRKQELTDEQKEINRELARQRISVEHSIGGIKRYDILSNTSRIHDIDLYDKMTASCAGLWNFFINR